MRVCDPRHPGHWLPCAVGDCVAAVPEPDGNGFVKRDCHDEVFHFAGLTNEDVGAEGFDHRDVRELEADPVDLGHQDEGLGQAPYHSESARICCLSGASGWDNPEMTFLSEFERTSGNFCTFIDDGNGVHVVDEDFQGG